MTEQLAKLALSWYQQHGRDLPWRRTDDPYAIWVAEVMLQQTRVETVAPYYKRWLERFPTVASLARADQDEVLNLWEGLGYYRRARYLHQAAQILVEQHAGELPQTVTELKQLPGIGDYTSAAIAAIAFDANALALDGNLRRVLARLFDIEDEISSSAAERRLRQHGQRLLPPGRAADFNQALMDLGALICTARSPRCRACPLENHCLARRRGVERERPVRRPTGEVPHVTRVAAVLTSRDKVLIGRRPEDRLLGGMWEFPGTELEQGVDPVRGLARALDDRGLGVELPEASRLGSYEHRYTHFRVTTHAYRAEIKANEKVLRERPALQWVRVSALEQYPMGKIDRTIAQDLHDDNLS